MPPAKAPDKNQIKIITINQPWATMIAIGAKRIETRSWTTRYRGLIGIHSSQELGADHLEAALSYPFEQALLAAGMDLRVSLQNDSLPANARPTNWQSLHQILPAGCLVAIGWLDSVHKTSGQPENELPGYGPISRQESMMGGYGPNRYGFAITKIHRLTEPYPMRGMLNLWNPPSGELDGPIWRWHQAEAAGNTRAFI